MTVVKGVRNTTIQIFIYTVAFVITSLLLTIYGYTGWIYFIVMAALGLYWIKLGAEGLRTKNSEKWARRMFHFSLIVLLALSFMLSIGAILP
jgi:protoheme IX farnesyltransferase